MKKKILIADDNVDFVKILKMRLEATGYEIECAYDGVGAIEKARAIKPDLIILDWKMPAGEGSSVMEYLNSEKETRNIPVIILSGVSESGMDTMVASLGAKAFIKKPFESKKLLKLIEDIIGEKGK